MGLDTRILAALLLKQKQKQNAVATGNAGPAPAVVAPPVRSVAAASSTATTRPVSPLQIQTDRLQSYQGQVAQTRPVLKPTGYVAPQMKETFHAQQARKEIEDKVLTVADKAAMTLPLPYVGETVGVLGAGVGAGIRGIRAIADVQKGNYGSAAVNATEAALGVAGGAGAGKGFDVLNHIAQQHQANQAVNTLNKLTTRPMFTAPAQPEVDVGADWLRNWLEGRATASMGGLSPADAGLSRVVGRPVIPSKPDWETLGRTKFDDGFYSPYANVAAVSPYKTGPFARVTAIHEAAHQYQQKGGEPINQALRLIEQSPKKTELGDYWNDPREIHSRLMELRYQLGLRPDEYVTSERFKQLVTAPPVSFEPASVARVKRGFYKDYPEQVVNWLNNVPSVALPLAGAGVAAGAIYGPRRPVLPGL